MKRRGPWRGVRCVAVYGCAALALGCSPSFEPEARLTKLRVLALRNEPVNPDPGQVTMFEALTYAPPASTSQPFEYVWSWCPLLGQPNDGYTCPLTQPQLDEVAARLGLTDVPPLMLGTDPTQAFRNPFTVADLAAFCQEGIEGVPIDCADDFPVRVNLRVTHAGAVQAATTILHLPAAEGVPPNANPRFDDANGSVLFTVKNGVEYAIDQQLSVTLPRLQITDLRARVTDAQAEPYMAPDDNGYPVATRERLVMSWFVETGDVGLDVGSSHTGYIPGQTELDQFQTAQWKPGQRATYSPDQSQLIVVLRDNRGGVSWTTGSVRLEPTP